MDNNFVEDIMSEIDSELSAPVKPLQKKRQVDKVKEIAVKQRGADSDCRRKAATTPKKKQRQVIAERRVLVAPLAEDRAHMTGLTAVITGVAIGVVAALGTEVRRRFIDCLEGSAL